MTKALLAAILLVILTLAACSNPSPTAIPTATPSPTATSTPAPMQPPAQPSNLWRGITIAPENRCSPYDSDEYRYSPSVEPRIVEAQGGIYGPYTGTWFESIKKTDIEHIVVRSEAHDSGLCAAGPATWSEFASDLLNLTLASPSVNRHQKSDNDIAEWLPDLNQCWYVDRTVQVRREYGLTIDRAEADAVDRILAGCPSTEMVVLAPGASTTATAIPTTTAEATPTPSTDVDALALWDGNGRITCAEARAHGIAPVHRGHSAYQYMRDGDGDGGGPGDARRTVDDHPVIIWCPEPHVLEQPSRFYTPDLKAQQRLAPAIGPVQGAALAVGVEQQHLESVRKCASQVGGDGGFTSAPFLVDDGDDRHTSTSKCTGVQIYSGT